MKIVIALFFIGIVYSLGSALYYMMNNNSTANMIKALSIRVGLSVVLFLLLIVAYYSGWITPSMSIRP